MGFGTTPEKVGDPFGIKKEAWFLCFVMSIWYLVEMSSFKIEETRVHMGPATYSLLLTHTHTAG